MSNAAHISTLRSHHQATCAYKNVEEILYKFQILVVRLRTQAFTKSTSKV